MLRLAQRGSVIGATAMLAACVGTPVDPGILDQVTPVEAFSDIALIGWLGGRACEDAERWGPGDALLFGLRLETPGGGVRRWLATLTLGRRDTLALHRVMATVNDQRVSFGFHHAEIAVRVVDDAGRELSSSVASVGDEFLMTGMYEACLFAIEHDLRPGATPDIDEAGAGRLARSILSLFTLFQVVQQNESLAPILREVVKVPSLLSMIGSFGVTLSLTPHLDRVKPGATFADAGPSYVFPLTIKANGENAMLCRMQVVQPRRPHRLAAGLVSIEAVHPTDARRRFSLRLLDYRCAQ